MAIRRFGEIGDVWKHLPLAEILAREAPEAYWESHAGAADYALVRTPARSYGVLHFLAVGAHVAAARDSRYAALLAPWLARERCPGSPLIALATLPAARFTFCDLDPESLASIRQEAKRRGVPESRVETLEADGPGTLIRALRELPVEEVRGLLFHVDPYRPLELGSSGVHAVDLFREATRLGARTMLWYGFANLGYRDQLFAAWDAERQRHGASSAGARLWRAEIAPEFLHPTIEEPSGSLIGAGVLCGNLAPATVESCRRLGRALEPVDASATLADGRPASLRFVEPAEA